MSWIGWRAIESRDVDLCFMQQSGDGAEWLESGLFIWTWWDGKEG